MMAMSLSTIQPWKPCYGSRLRSSSAGGRTSSAASRGVDLSATTPRRYVQYRSLTVSVTALHFSFYFYLGLSRSRLPPALCGARQTVVGSQAGPSPASGSGGFTTAVGRLRCRPIRASAGGRSWYKGRRSRPQLRALDAGEGVRGSGLGPYNAHARGTTRGGGSGHRRTHQPCRCVGSGNQRKAVSRYVPQYFLVQ